MTSNICNVALLNCKGLNNCIKVKRILSSLKNLHINIAFLRETHLKICSSKAFKSHQFTTQYYYNNHYYKNIIKNNQFTTQEQQVLLSQEAHQYLFPNQLNSYLIQLKLTLMGDISLLEDPLLDLK